MRSAKDITGMRFGRLTVLSRTPRPEFYAGGDSWWKVRCDCGTESIVNGKNLRNGHTRSCGCYRREVSGKRMKEWHRRMGK